MEKAKLELITREDFLEKYYDKIHALVIVKNLWRNGGNGLEEAINIISKQEGYQIVEDGMVQATMTYTSSIPVEYVYQKGKEETLFIEKIGKRLKKVYDKFKKHNYRIGYASTTGEHLDILMNKVELKKFLKQCNQLSKDVRRKV